MRRNGGLIQTGVYQPSKAVATGIWDLHDHYTYKRQELWPVPKTIDTFQDANGISTYTEGQSLTINITTSGYEEGDLIYWKIGGDYDGYDSKFDVGQPVRGAVSLDANGNATLYISTTRDGDSHFRGEELQVYPTDSSYNTIAGAPSAYYHPVNDAGNYNQWMINVNNWSGSAISNTKNKGHYARTFPAYGHPSSQSTTVTGGYHWSDWGNDVFDGWGGFHFYHDTHGVGEMNSTTPAEATWSSNFNTGSPNSTLANMTNWVTEGSNGTTNVCYMLIDFNQANTNDSLKRIVKMRYGYIAQGVYMMNFSWAYGWQMRLVMGGNMGSDSQTNNFNFSSQQGSTWYYGNYNYQTNTSAEFLSTFWKSHIDSEYGPLGRGISGDNLHLWTPMCSNGLTMWFIKGNYTSFTSSVAGMNSYTSSTTQLN